MNQIKKIVLVDGTNYMYRFFHATSQNTYTLRTSNNLATNAVFPFIRFINRLIKERSIGQYYIIFDGKKKTWRHQLFKDYKSQRDKMPSDLFTQFQIMYEFLNIIEIPYFITGIDEADDYIASLAKYASARHYKVAIYSSDDDLLQLVDDNIEINRTKKQEKIVINNDNFFELYGLKPIQIIDKKALQGDPSDNIPGVAGIGKKTAVDLLSKYVDVDEIFMNFDLLPRRVKTKLENQKQKVLFYKKLVKLKTHLDVTDLWKSDPYQLKNYDDLRDYFVKYEMARLASQVLPKEAMQSKTDLLNFENIITIKDPCEITKKPAGLIFNIHYHSSVASDINNHADALGIYIALVNISAQELVYYCTIENFKNNTAWIDLLADSKIKKIFYDVKIFLNALFNKKIYLNLKNFVDLHLAFFLRDSNVTITIKNLHHNYKLNILNALSYDDVMVCTEFCDKTIKNVYYCYLTLIYQALYQQFLTWVSDQQNSKQIEKYYKIDLLLAIIIRNMECQGVLVNVPFLNQYDRNVAEKLDVYEKKIHELAGYEFNVNSQKELVQLLYFKLNLQTPVNMKKQTTESDLLCAISNQHPVVEYILNYRKFKKLHSTYIKGLLKFVDHNDVIYPLFHQAVAATGRLSASHPNLQNIVVKNSEQRQVRKALIARKNHFFVSYDYDQIELRLLAHFSNSKDAITALNNDIDFHLQTAQLLFEKDHVTQNERAFAKTLNYSIIYGVTPYTVANKFKIYQTQARDLINKYKKIFNVFFVYKDVVFQNAAKQHYIETLCYHKRFVNDINSPNKLIKRRWERIAFNSLIQGSAADLIKLAMIKINQYINENNLPLWFAAQIHDELIFEVESTLKNSNHLKKIQEIMINIFPLKVQLKVHSKSANDWYHLKFE